MTPRDDKELGSLGGFSTHEFDESSVDGSFANAQRYVSTDVISRGGMGEVSAARDVRLDRMVAVKRPHAEKNGMFVGQFAREARITARLEHPGIVPIYDAGLDGNGRPYYVMRLIKGETLEGAMRRMLPAKRQRHLLAATQAVAYAHRCGIVHGDLKPSNILVGEYGDTQVADWGLARDTVENEGAEIASQRVARAQGTPVYMSPEMARGEPVSFGSDVWALGICLYQAMVESRPYIGVDAELLVAHIGKQSAMTIDPSLKGELRSIVGRALAVDRNQRYADAQALADDLAAFLDGRNVISHHYSVAALAWRLVVRIKVPLFIAALALVVVALSIAGSFRRIQTARDQAEQAERTTANALRQATISESDALTRGAIRALDLGDIGEAGLLAIRSAQIAPSPASLGIEIAALSSPHPGNLETFVIPGCIRVVPSGWARAICHGEHDIAMYDITSAGAKIRWTTKIDARRVFGTAAGLVAFEGAGTVTVLNNDDGTLLLKKQLPLDAAPLRRVLVHDDAIIVADGRVVTVIDRRNFSVHPGEKMCPRKPLTGLGIDGDQVIALCETDLIAFSPLVPDQHRFVGTFPELGKVVPSDIAVLSPGRLVVVGNGGGAVVDYSTKPAVLAIAGMGPTERVTSLGGDWIGVERATGTGSVWNLAEGREVFRLPGGYSFRFGSYPIGVATGGDFFARWRLEGARVRHAVQLGTGLSAITAMPPLRLAVGRSDGAVDLFNAITLERIERINIGQHVIKSVDVSPDGQKLAIAIANAFTPPRKFADGVVTMLTQPEQLPARRIVFADSTHLLAAHWKPGLSMWRNDIFSALLTCPEIIDLDRGYARRSVRGLDVTGGIWNWGDGEWQFQSTHADALAVGNGNLSDWYVVAKEQEVTAQSGRVEQWHFRPASRIMTVIVAPTDDVVAVARVDGMIDVVDARTGKLRATLRGHTQRVAGLAFLDATTLFSIGWDGFVMRWDLRSLAFTQEVISTAVRAAWGPLLEGDEPK
jgi:WD40 repeat protein